MATSCVRLNGVYRKFAGNLNLPEDIICLFSNSLFQCARPSN